MSATTFPGALEQLRSAQKPAKGPAYTRYVNRSMGRVLAAGSFKLGLTPNQVSLISFAFSAGGLALAALVVPTFWSSLVVCLLLAFGYALDSADGQLARLRKSSSRTGEWLDHVLDCAKITIFHLTILIVFYRFFELESQAWYLVPMAFLLVANLMFFAGILTDQLKRSIARSAPDGGQSSPRVPGSHLKSILMLPVDYGVQLWALLFLFAGSTFVWIYFMLLVLNAVFLGAYFKTWLGEIA